MSQLPKGTLHHRADRTKRRMRVARPIALRGSSEATRSELNYEHLRKELHRAVNCVCPQWMVDSSEDIVQIALMRVMELHRKSDRTRQFSATYLWKVAYSALVDERRRLQRRQETPIQADAHENAFPAGSPTPEHDTHGRELGEGIRECLGDLIENRRRAVALHLAGHSVGETAKLLGWDLKRTENLVYRGLRDLRRGLISRGLEP